MKRSVEAGDNNLNLLPIILLLVASGAAIIAMFVFPGFSLAAQVSLQNHKVDFFLNKEEKYSFVAT